MNDHIQEINLEESGIAYWQRVGHTRVDLWRAYFGIVGVDNAKIQSYAPYQHPYRYALTDEDVVRIIVCAVIEIVRYNTANGMSRAYFGNSGGLDSATTCALLAKAMKLSADLGQAFDVVSYGMPIASNPEHNQRAASTAEAFGLTHVTVDVLDDVLEAFKKTVVPLGDQYGFTEEEHRRGLGNVKARIRMIVNFFGTTKAGGYVVSTDNLSELYMAFWTLMGDVGAFGPIQNILKGLELPAIGYALGVPEHTLGAKPTDGLEVHTSLDDLEGGDTDAFKGVRYPHLDAIICYAAKAGFDLEHVSDVTVDASLIQSEYATQEIVDHLTKTMGAPGSVWKRTSGSIGIAISREDLGLPPVDQLVEHLS